MQLHHQKHHAAYVNNYNIAEEKLQKAVAASEYFDICTICCILPYFPVVYITKRRIYVSDDTAAIIELGPALKFNGGGHLNHSIFWDVLTPSASAGKPSSKILSSLHSFILCACCYSFSFSNPVVAIVRLRLGWVDLSPSAFATSPRSSFFKLMPSCTSP